MSGSGLLPPAHGGDRWRATTPSALLASLPVPSTGLAVLAIDGHGGGGKSTLASRLTETSRKAGRPSAVVATDDVAWHHSMFDWSQALIEGVLDPVRTGRGVRFRPPGWVERDRPGAIEVPAGTRLLVVEGTGAGRTELIEVTDALIWVDSDPVAARERGLARDLASGVNGTEASEVERFWDAWMAEEIVFMDRHRAWERADAIVSGTPTTPLADGEIAVAC